MKTLLIVTQYYWPENFKGNDIAVDFTRRGYKVIVLTGKPNYPQGKFYSGYHFLGRATEFHNGVKIIRVPLIPRGNTNLTLILNYLSFVFFAGFAALFRIKEKIDLIFVQQLSPATLVLPAILLKKIKKAPLVLWVLDLWPESITATTNINNPFIIKSLKRLMRFIYTSSDRILISSRNFKSSILTLLGDSQKQIIYFPNWAEDIFLNKENKDFPFTLPDTSRGFTIIYAGNIGEAQDFEAVLKAVERTKQHNINWYIIGDGRKKSWVEKQKEEHHLTNLFLPGRFPLEAMPNIFKKADAMLVSLKNQPVFELTVPAKIQAYLASGKIILGMLNGEGAEIINASGAGFACNAGQSNLLAEHAIHLSKRSKEELTQLSENAKSYYLNNFDKNKLFDSLESLFSEVVDATHKPVE